MGQNIHSGPFSRLLAGSRACLTQSSRRFHGSATLGTTNFKALTRNQSRFSKSKVQFLYPFRFPYHSLCPVSLLKVQFKLKSCISLSLTRDILYVAVRHCYPEIMMKHFRRSFVNFRTRMMLKDWKPCKYHILRLIYYTELFLILDFCKHCLSVDFLFNLLLILHLCNQNNLFQVWIS